MNKKKTDYLFSSIVYLRIFFFKILDSNLYLFRYSAVIHRENSFEKYNVSCTI